MPWSTCKSSIRPVHQIAPFSRHRLSIRPITSLHSPGLEYVRSLRSQGLGYRSSRAPIRTLRSPGLEYRSSRPPIKSLRSQGLGYRSSPRRIRLLPSPDTRATPSFRSLRHPAPPPTPLPCQPIIKVRSTLLPSVLCPSHPLCPLPSQPASPPDHDCRAHEKNPLDPVPSLPLVTH